MSFLTPGSRICVICERPIYSPTKTQLSHTVGPCSEILKRQRKARNLATLNARRRGQQQQQKQKEEA